MTVSVSLPPNLHLTDWQNELEQRSTLALEYLEKIPLVVGSVKHLSVYALK